MMWKERPYRKVGIGELYDLALIWVMAMYTSDVREESGVGRMIVYMLGTDH